MKKCKKCGSEYEGDSLFCTACGGKLTADDDEAPAFCRYCGGSLVNEYERSQGCCVKCEHPEYNVAPKAPKYLRRLRVFEILCYICGAITPILLAATNTPELFIYGLIALIPWIGMGAVFGALREILKKIK